MCRVTMDHLRVPMGHLRVTIGDLRVTIGHIGKHKANTTELHPKVRQTCLLFCENIQFHIMSKTAVCEVCEHMKIKLENACLLVWII